MNNPDASDERGDPAVVLEDGVAKTNDPVSSAVARPGATTRRHEPGEPPRMQTRDLRPLPFGYGMGSGTLASWLGQKAQATYGETADEYHQLE